MKCNSRILDWKIVNVFIVVAVLVCNSACSISQESVGVSKDNLNSTSKRKKVGNPNMSLQTLIESLDNIDLTLISSNEAIKDAVYDELPMSQVEGIALRILTPVSIAEQHDTKLIILIGISSETNSKTPLDENARIVWTNKESNRVSEVELYPQPTNKIPMPEDKVPLPPLNPVLPQHLYSVEVVNIREKLKIDWVPSTYTFQVVVGELISNKVDFELVEYRD
ncbi:hypothetical protein TDB9533_03003 [Thalassocella blandensis]|nr:hypothetical protein TDB9533_03003 [Thalassocella blandensis]